MANSETFRLEFASQVFKINGDTEAAKKRIDDVQSFDGMDRTPHEAVEYYVAVARAYGTVGMLDEARSALRIMHRDTFGYWLRAKKEPQYRFWSWAFLKACRSSPESAGVSSLAFAQFILGMDKTEGDETAARLVPDLLFGAGGVPHVAAGVISRLVESDLATWANIADSALSSVVEHAPSLAENVLIAFSRLVIPFVQDDAYPCLRICLEAIEPTKRPQSIEYFVSSIAKWCPPSQRQEILTEIIKIAPEAESIVSAILPEVNVVTKFLYHLSHGERGESRSLDGGAENIDVDSLQGLVDYSDGTKLSVDIMAWDDSRLTQVLIVQSRLQIVFVTNPPKDVQVFY